MLTKSLIRAMHRDYRSGMSFAKLAKKYDRCRRTIRDRFVSRGLKLRPYVLQTKRTSNGGFAPFKPPTASEIRAMIQKLEREAVPAGLQIFWRRWPMSRRRDFILAARKRFPESLRPAGPFSGNVVPFDYWTPAAQHYQRQANAGRDSHHWITKIKPCSQGVIYRDTLYFWTGKSQCYAEGCQWTLELGRPLLHHVIWEECNQRPVPAATTVIHLDGNKNNFDPGNLSLRTMAECAQINRGWKKRKLITLN